MSDARSIHTRFVTWPLMFRPRMSCACASAASASAAYFTPPALPRPPVYTWAFTITGAPIRSAAARASSGVSAISPSETGIPNRLKSCLPWYS